MKGDQSSEFIRYWPSYAQWTQTQADLGRTIQRRHAFFAAELAALLAPKRLDDRRGFSSFERQVVFYRDNQRCQRCAMLGEEHPVKWTDAEVHHILPFSEGGHTTAPPRRTVHWYIVTVIQKASRTLNGSESGGGRGRRAARWGKARPVAGKRCLQTARTSDSITGKRRTLVWSRVALYGCTDRILGLTRRSLPRARR